MRQPLGWIKLHFDLAPVTVLNLVVWTVSEYILVAQLYSNFCSHIRQFVGIVDGEQAPAGNAGDFAQQRGTGNFFRLRWGQSEDADLVNLQIGLFHHSFDLILCVAAMFIAAI
jgi:hypothetical protein